MQESKSCALPLGDSPLKTLFLTLHASLNYKRKGWVVGLEPTISRTTIWRANQLHHTHHNEPGGIRTLDLRLRRPLLYPAELQTHFNIPFSKGSPYFYGKAGDGNRTHVSSLEGWCSTIELHPHEIYEIEYCWAETVVSALMPSSGIEPETRGFSVLCSTNWANWASHNKIYFKG